MSNVPEMAGSTGRLRRELRLVDAVGIGLGAIIGAGLFVVTGVAAGVAGPGVLAGLLIAGVAAMCNALSSAQLAAAYPVAGGTYEYGYRVLSPWLGYAAGWMFLASKLTAGGTVALGFAGYLAAFVPALPLRGTAVAAVLLLTGVNLAGIRKAGRLNTLVVSITLLTLLVFVVTGLPHFRRERLVPFTPHGWPGVLESAGLLFFAYTGYARLATLGEEVHEPRRTIPRAIVLALGIAIVLYLGVTLVAVGTAGAEELAATAAPLQRAARSFPISGIDWVVSLGATTAMLGVLLSQLLAISRMLLAMARRGDLPRLLDHVSPRYGVPDRGVLLAGGVVALLALVGTLQAILATAAFTILLYYGITNLAALRMPVAEKLVPNVVPLLGLASCLVLAFALAREVVLTGLGLLLAGVLLRVLFHRAGAHSTGRPPAP